MRFFITLFEEEDRDIISSLPDEVLYYIMSFLPTKYAVATSILSRRWRYTWTCVPHLDFDDTLVSHPQTSARDTELCFTRFINRVLLLRSVPIKKLRLNVVNDSSSVWKDINSWICAAVMHNVEEVDLNYCTSQLSQILFSCKMLKVLKLHAKIGFKIFDSVCLPRLKVLHLLNVNACNLEKILSGSPVLEELIIHRNPDDYRATTLYVVSSSLKRLTIHQIQMNGELNSNSYRVDICAQKLEFLELVDHISGVFNVMKLSSPLRATIDVSRSRRTQVSRLLRKIANVTVLSLSANVVKALFQASDVNFPWVRYLSQLEVGVTGNGWFMLPKILLYSPNLEAFTLKNDADADADAELSNDAIPGETIFKENYVPNCLLCSLERLEFKRFKGNSAEMEILDYFLKNATILKKFIISFSSISFEKQANILKKILMSPRASTACQFLIT